MGFEELVSPASETIASQFKGTIATTTIRGDEQSPRRRLDAEVQ
jgi:hypothetical protein